MECFYDLGERGMDGLALTMRLETYLGRGFYSPSVLYSVSYYAPRLSDINYVLESYQKDVRANRSFPYIHRVEPKRILTILLAS